jgi:hypothetical protein
VVEYIEEMRKKVGNNLIGDMTLEQLKDLHRAFTMIKTVVQKSNKLFGEKNRATIAEQGESAMAEIEKQGHKATFTHTGKLASTMSFNNLKPIYLIERTKSKVLQERMQEILDGESIWAIDMEEGRAFCEHRPSRLHRPPAMSLHTDMRALFATFIQTPLPEILQTARETGRTDDLGRPEPFSGMFGLRRFLGVFMTEHLDLLPGARRTILDILIGG